MSIISLCTTPLAHGQAQGTLGLYGDTEGMLCSVEDRQLGHFVIHAVIQMDSAKAVEFSAPLPPCLVGVTWIGDTDVFPVTIGDSQTGVGIATGGVCIGPPLHVLTINYFGNGQTLPCCEILLSGWQTKPVPEMLGCSGGQFPVSTVAITVNPNTTCSCTLPIEESTWGRVKSLYSLEK